MYIREVKHGELQALLALYQQLHGNPMPEMNEELSRLWDGLMMDDNYHIVAAFDEERLISSCTLVVIPNLTHAQSPYALIENVVTDERYRKQGAASACLRFAKMLAQNKRCYKIMLQTGSKDESTLDFYRRAGFNSEDKTAFIQWL